MRLDVFKWRSFAKPVDPRDAVNWHRYMEAIAAWVAWSKRAS